MQKYYNIPLLFFVLAAGIGLFLRWQFIDPTPGIRYTWFLHSHSHVMFLGWVLNILYLASIEYFFPASQHRRWLVFFLVLQTLVVAMMISFPLQGYGTYSIIFSTVHTLATMVFIAVFFRTTRSKAGVPLWFARAAWIFFLLSTAGPFSLGYLMANDLGRTVWYNFSIYYYLHFQYNGFFLFGVIGLFYQLLENKGIRYDNVKARTFGTYMAVSCVPAYFLSTLFAAPGLFFNAIGGIAALLQIYGLAIFASALKTMLPDIRRTISKPAFYGLSLVFICLATKSILQLLSAHPYIATLAYALRPVVIAYLHLALVGVISWSLLVWYYERGFLQPELAYTSFLLLLVGFVGSELALTVMPWWSAVVGRLPAPAEVIFGFSVLLFLSAALLLLAFRVPRPRCSMKDQA